MRPIVVIESPYGGTVAAVARHVRYGRACLHDSLLRGESPFASHLLYTQALDDTIPAERDLGIEAGFVFRFHATMTAVYEDLGVSPGMQRGIAHSEDIGVPVEWRRLGGRWA